MTSIRELISCGSIPLFVLPSFRSYYRLFREAFRLQRHLRLRQWSWVSFVVENWPLGRLLLKRPVGLSLHWPISKSPASTLPSDYLLADTSYKHVIGLSVSSLHFERISSAPCILLQLSHDVLLERSPRRHDLLPVTSVVWPPIFGVQTQGTAPSGPRCSSIIHRGQYDQGSSVLDPSI